MQRKLNYIVSCVALCLLMPLISSAAVMRSQLELDAAQQRALDFGLTPSVVVVGITSSGSRVITGTGTVFEDIYVPSGRVVLFAGHSALASNFVSFEFYNGDYYDSLSTSGPLAVSSADNLIVHPEYDGTVYSIDTAMVRVPQGIPGIPTAEFYSGSRPYKVDVVDYGRPAIVSQPSMTWDGICRLVTMKMNSSYSSVGSQYATAQFRVADNIAYNAGATVYNSGGAAYLPFADTSKFLFYAHINWISDANADGMYTGMLKASEIRTWFYDALLDAAFNNRSYDLIGFQAMATLWLTDDWDDSFNPVWDLIEDGFIDINDLALFAQNWLSAQ